MFDAMFPSHWSRIRKLYWLNKLKNNVATYEVVVGNPVSFTAKAAPLRQLSVAFSPKQDLHGYDSPWPAGGGKNLCSSYKNAYVSKGTTDSVYLTGTGTTLFFECVSGVTYTVSGISINRGNFAVFDTMPTNGARSENDGTFNVGTTGTFTPSASGVCAVYVNNALVDTSTAQIEEGSVATDFAPYSNLCPILGWDSLNVEMRGKNVLDEKTVHTDNNYRYFNVPLGKSNTLYMSLTDKDTSVNVSDCLLGFTDTDANGVPRSYRWVLQSGTLYDNRSNEASVGTVGKLCDFVFVYPNTEDAWNRLNQRYYISVNYPSTDHDYHAYNPLSRSISISLGSTVYSGWVDVVTGVGEITWAAVDLGSLSWTYVSAYDCFTALVGRDDYRAKDAFSAKCSSYPFVGGYTNLTDKSCAYIYNVHVAVKDAAHGTDANAFKTAMSGVKLVYELATPIPISLTPQEVESLAGDNVLFSDANGDLTVEYRSN